MFTTRSDESCSPPQAINVGPTLISLSATGINVQPQGINVSPDLIVVGPYDTTVAGQVTTPTLSGALVMSLPWLLLSIKYDTLCQCCNAAHPAGSAEHTNFLRWCMA